MYINCYQLIPVRADLLCVGKVDWIPKAEGWVKSEVL